MARRTQQKVLTNFKGMNYNIDFPLGEDSLTNYVKNMMIVDGKLVSLNRIGMGGYVSSDEKIDVFYPYTDTTGYDAYILATNKKLWIYQSTNALIDGTHLLGSPAAITNYNLGNAYRWSYETFMDKIYFTAPNTNVQVWDKDFTIAANVLTNPFKDYKPAFTSTDSTGTAFSAKIVRSFNNMLMFFNIGTSYPNTIYYTQIADASKMHNIGSEATTNYTTILDGGDKIVAAERLGSYMVVYKDKSISIMSYTGDSYIFSTSTAVSNKGTLSSGAVIKTTTHHYFISTDHNGLFDGFYRFNGAYAEPLPNMEGIRDLIAKDLDINYQELITGYYIPSERQYVWFIPTLSAGSGRQSKMICYNDDNDTWTIREVKYRTSSPVGDWKYLTGVSEIVLWNNLVKIHNFPLSTTLLYEETVDCDSEPMTITNGDGTISGNPYIYWNGNTISVIGPLVENCLFNGELKILSPSVGQATAIDRDNGYIYISYILTALGSDLSGQCVVKYRSQYSSGDHEDDNGDGVIDASDNITPVTASTAMPVTIDEMTQPYHYFDSPIWGGRVRILLYGGEDGTFLMDGSEDLTKQVYFPWSVIKNGIHFGTVGYNHSLVKRIKVRMSATNVQVGEKIRLRVKSYYEDGTLNFDNVYENTLFEGDNTYNFDFFTTARIIDIELSGGDNGISRVIIYSIIIDNQVAGEE